MGAVSHDNSNVRLILQFFVFKSSYKTREEVTWDETAIKKHALPERMTVRPIMNARRAEEGRKNFNQTMFKLDTVQTADRKMGNRLLSINRTLKSGLKKKDYLLQELQPDNEVRTP